ncbi:MAG: hypothetical protein ACI848_001797, partial [Roseivirga sp.]
MNKVSTIPFCKTGYFSKTICDYLDQKESISSFYGNFPDIKGFEKQIQTKKATFKPETRTVLVDSLTSQYKNIKSSLKTDKNIQSLLSKNTFTVTTGHQLNLFTGPLYFLYKIISTINLTEQLKEEFPASDFV